jgi:hypothetical protein
VKVAVFRTPGLVSSVSWHPRRQAVMVVPDDPALLGDRPSFTDYDPASGLGWIRLKGSPRPPAFRIAGEPRIDRGEDRLTVSFDREIPGVARQGIGYCALSTGEVLVFSRWRALRDIEIVELADHPFRWIEIPGFLPPRPVADRGPGAWSVDGKLLVQVLGGAGGKVREGALLGSVRDEPWSARAGDLLGDSVGVYRPERPGREFPPAKGGPDRVVVGGWTVERAADGGLTVEGPGPGR